MKWFVLVCGVLCSGLWCFVVVCGVLWCFVVFSATPSSWAAWFVSDLVGNLEDRFSWPDETNNNGD